MDHIELLGKCKLKNYFLGLQILHQHCLILEENQSVVYIREIVDLAIQLRRKLNALPLNRSEHQNRKNYQT